MDGKGELEWESLVCVALPAKYGWRVMNTSTQGAILMFSGCLFYGIIVEYPSYNYNRPRKQQEMRYGITLCCVIVEYSGVGIEVQDKIQQKRGGGGHINHM